ncbi:MAG: LytR C-terminal domain-containing protein [Pseudonocardia sp.]
MTSPAPSGGSSALRIGGLALVGVAVVAALGGLFTLATGGDTAGDQTLASASSAAPVEPAPVEPPPVDPSAAPSPLPAPLPAPAPVPAPTTAPAEEPIAPYTPESTPGDTVTPVKAPLRVYNNSRISGLAEQAAADFRAAGWQVTAVGNYSSGVIPTSTVYYQPGSEAAAESLAREFGMRAKPGFGGLQFGGDNLVVIVTREYGG